MTKIKNEIYHPDSVNAEYERREKQLDHKHQNDGFKTLMGYVALAGAGIAVIGFCFENKASERDNTQVQSCIESQLMVEGVTEKHPDVSVKGMSKKHITVDGMDISVKTVDDKTSGKALASVIMPKRALDIGPDAKTKNVVGRCYTSYVIGH